MIRCPLALILTLVPCTALAQATEPPVAQKKPHDVVSPHGTRTDP